MQPLRTSEQIRADFLEFFREKGHEVVPSASLVPHGDPTLLFTNAGMNQFKDVFLGTGERPYNRAVDTQKCLRVSGKHNDLEEVGHDTYHHTLFEMLGNWSFGDYFKKEAVAYAWELLVGRWGLPADRLFATVHEGDERLGLAPDDEAADYWRTETAILPEHIKFCRSKDNFWMMGDTGPCGPCSEIHIDLRPDEERARVPGIDLVNADDPRVMELWNLVFIQYNAQPDGTLQPLASRHVDTGMGFERVVAVLQEKSSNYDTDLFAPILARVAELSPREDVRGYDAIMAEAEGERERVRIAMRVVADHIRAVAFAVADGASPGNVGRGYVIRRILRRAVRYGYQTLGFREPFLFRLIDPLVEKMGESFPELVQQREYMERVIRAEEENFLQTLGTGIASFERIVPYIERLAGTEEMKMEEGEVARVLDALRADRQTLDLLGKAYGGKDTEALLDAFSRSAAQRVMPGEVAFLLHDTYGFPVDLTQLMAREEGLGVDMDGYARLMADQKERGRSAAHFRMDEGEAVRRTEVSQGDDSEFHGYDVLIVEGARIRRVQTIPGEDGDERYGLVLDHTPFYAESGGQIGDTGVIVVGGEELQVLDTQKAQSQIIHFVDRLPQALEADVTLRVDGARRGRIQKHHTATHLLHAVLRGILGPHVQQKGSLVAPDRLRFDFSHYERVLPVQLKEIEHLVNESVQRNIKKKEERHVPREEAVARGAMALFGEKYGEHVRVITFDPEFSIELCGGTHVAATGEIGLFHFISESSVAAGVRRIEAVTGIDALRHVTAELEQLERTRSHFRTLGRPVDEEIAELLEGKKALEKELDALRTDQLASGLGSIAASAQTVGSVRVAAGRIPATDMNTLRDLATQLIEKMGTGSVCVLGTEDPEGGKVYLAAAVSEDVLKTTSLKAGNLVGALAKRVGGGGGGRPNLATAGGRQPENLDAALAAAVDVVRDGL